MRVTLTLILDAYLEHAVDANVSWQWQERQDFKQWNQYQNKTNKALVWQGMKTLLMGEKSIDRTNEGFVLLFQKSDWILVIVFAIRNFNLEFVDEVDLVFIIHFRVFVSQDDWQFWQSAIRRSLKFIQKVIQELDIF